MRRWLTGAAISVLVLAGALVALNFERLLDQFAPLDLDQPPGFFTGLHLRLLDHNPRKCFASLERAAVRVRPITNSDRDDGCGYQNAGMLERSGVDYGRPVLLRCPALVALVLWERHLLAPAAERELGKKLTGIRHLGTYACRNINHARLGRRSEHARANAIDISGFTFGDGRTVTLSKHWNGDTPESRFLRAARNGACRVFTAVLSPDHNRAHYNHLHLDRGLWPVCR